jgi:hypothetical protein
MPFDRCTEVTSKPLSIPARKEEGLEGYVGEKNAAKLEGSIALTILGDPVVGRALMLLLRGSGYEAKFVPASPLLSQHLWLKGSDLVLLTPTPELSSEDREALVASIEERTSSLEMQVLELATPFQETPKGAMEGERWHYVPWPCNVEELERWIEAVLPVAH